MIVVQQSASGKSWILTPCDERLIAGICQRYGVSDIMARLLVARDIDVDDVELFLSPSLRHQLPDPLNLKDMEKASLRLVTAVQNNEQIVVFGDYDVDGATSTALLCKFLKNVGATVKHYIPDRIDEGYGPNVAAFEQLIKDGAQIIVTVDCGTMAHAPVAAANAAGAQVIVIDHHAAEAALPPAYAVVNPNRLDETEQHKQLGHLAAVGVTFLFIVAINRHLREAGWYANGRFEPDLRNWLDLVALGTICDVVPLKGLNRVFVSQGLKVMAHRGNAGLAALADCAGVNDAPSTYHASFVFGPRINASGRIGQGEMSARLLMTEDAFEARELATKLCALNEERKALEQTVYEETIGQIAAMVETTGLLLVCGMEWHQGVIGIVAARLKEKLNRPVIICTQDKHGHVKGSGRSVTGVDLGAAVLAARQAELLTSGGGHPMAAGLTTTADKFAALDAFLTARVNKQLECVAVQRAIDFAGMIALSAATEHFINQVEQLSPYGSGNPEPMFILSDVLVNKAEVFGNGHVRCFLSSVAGGSLKGIAFRHADGPVGQLLLSPKPAPLHLAARLRVSRWQGIARVEATIEDAAHAI